MRTSDALPNVIADASAAPFAYRAAMNRLLARNPAAAHLVFVIQMLFGIYLVHLKHGWFVVGHGFNGMEYSVTLIAALFAIALTAPHEGNAKY